MIFNGNFVVYFVHALKPIVSEVFVVEKIWNEIEDLAKRFEECQKTLAAIGDETRQHIILEMARMDYNGSRVPDITARTNLSRPAVSHHLQILKEAGVVKMRKEGRMTYYYLDPDMAAFSRVSNVLMKAVEICSRLPNRSGEEEQ